MKNYPIVVSCDWFSYSCSCEGGVLPELGEAVADKLTACNFHFEESPEHHPFYECSVLAKHGNAPLAHLFFRCKRADRAFSCQVKVDNSRLYYSRWAESLHALLRALRWRVQFVNRIDICADFNYFANGRLPLSFCQDYLSQPTKNRPSFIRHSSNKVRAVATRTLRSLNYETLSWGTRDSTVQTNLYNKSLELETKCDKPWIRQRWVEGGLLHGEIDGKKHYVWRVEFSINPSALMMIKSDTDEVIGNLNINNVCNPAALIETWNVLHPRYFTFHFLTRETVNNPKIRVRDLPIVTLFERDNCVKYKVKGLQYYHKSTRTDKLLIRRLLESIDREDLTGEEKESVARVVDYLFRRTFQKQADYAKENMASNVLTQYLKSCFMGIVPEDEFDSISLRRKMERRATRWVRMLQGVHNPDISNFAEALRQLEVITGTEAFESCLRFANYACGTTMPDDAISDWVDDEVLREAYCMPISESANYPDEVGSYQP